MSNTTARSELESISDAHPHTASLASASRLTTWMSRSVSVRTRVRNWGAFSATRHASVAISPARATRWWRISAGADLQGIERALDRLLRKPPGGGHALAKPDDARERVDHLEPARRGPRDQQTAIVGAEIERRIRAAIAAMPISAADGSVRWFGGCPRLRSDDRARPWSVRERPTSPVVSGTRTAVGRRIGAALFVPLHSPSPAPAITHPRCASGTLFCCSPATTVAEDNRR